MLILTVKNNTVVREFVILELPDGSKIEVHLKEIQRGQAKLAFHCPKEINIKRKKEKK